MGMNGVSFPNVHKEESRFTSDPPIAPERDPFRWLLDNRRRLGWVFSKV